MNWNVFKFRLHRPRKMIRATGRTVRGRLLHTSLTSFTEHLHSACQSLLHVLTSDDSGRVADARWQSCGLLTLTARTMFQAIFHTVFGRDDSSQFNSQLAYHNFQARTQQPLASLRHCMTHGRSSRCLSVCLSACLSDCLCACLFSL